MKNVVKVELVMETKNFKVTFIDELDLNLDEAILQRFGDEKELVDYLIFERLLSLQKAYMIYDHELIHVEGKTI